MGGISYPPLENNGPSGISRVCNGVVWSLFISPSTQGFM